MQPVRGHTRSLQGVPVALIRLYGGAAVTTFLQVWQSKTQCRVSQMGP